MKKDNMKKSIIIAIIVAVLVLTIGGTFALWTYFKIGGNQVLIAGDIYMKYTGVNNLSVTNAVPSDTYNKNDYFEFTVEKKTEKINKNIWYEIILKRDDSSEIDDSLLNFNLVKVENSKETLLLSNYSSNDLSNDKIYVDIANSNVEKITYRLYMWLPTNIEYTLSSPVSVKVEVISKVVNNPLEETVLQNGKATDVIKSTINIPGGVIGITNDNKKIRTTSDDIREYRYSGFFANNYIKFNNELWRIVGIFKDENGQELLKIVRNDVINGNKFPEDYQVSEETYNLKYSAEKYNILNENYVYYNRKSGENIKREWSTSAIQYWLNSKGTGDIGYLDSIAESSRKMIQETKYYLGNITDATNGIEDTPIQAYANERKSVQCEVTSKSHEQNPPCYIWPGFQATWTGKIGLMYPSDFGFSADSQYWNNQLNYKNFTIPSYSSWFNSLSNKGLEFLISPTSDSDNSAAMLRNVNYMSLGGVVDYIRPTLYLKNNVEIILGNGTKESPYEVKCTSCTN